MKYTIREDEELCTADLKFSDLCREIDYWKNIAKEALKDAEYWKGEYMKHLNNSLASAQKGVADALMFALSVTDDENGNLVIPKESRKNLAKRYK